MKALTSHHVNGHHYLLIWDTERHGEAIIRLARMALDKRTNFSWVDVCICCMKMRRQACEMECAGR